MRRLALVVPLVLALVFAFVLGTSSVQASPGCRAFGQDLIAGHAQDADERPGVGEEAVAFAPANDDVAFFKSLSCG